MNTRSDGPIISSEHLGNQPSGGGKKVLIVIVLFVLFGMGAFFLVQKDQYQEEEELSIAEEQLIELLDEQADTPKTVAENEIIAVAKVKEEGTADFFYKRALQKEREKDYVGAVEDYTSTIAKANRYSAEMWNSLNNRGIINAKQFKDYKIAIKDFNKIIQIETNRSNGEVNATRLEAGYTNRAYIKKMRGDKEGACDDLYEALSLGVESSIDFIENQINKNCN